ncbi:hypothetical protein BGW36DRAFT_375023 [Talaromyces proteolyticus]|uniref:Uncharacterized protein n=1 Tax=Talaromyces proteolyticus TaxID=1131652 RepID=A0AAD4L0T7_9EURO|nr:uncharacterized protein BGW36DRAFT_375023 [Talaromyces proteolyticus]KAH8700814.1 hypothetical protein BGW36DRAFT_375023 [Talaromyces proteolyticus]
MDPIPSRHITLPFDIYKDRKTVFSSEVTDVLLMLYPQTTSLSFVGYFLIFHLTSLSPKPWPKTIGGVQSYFTIGENDMGRLSAFINGYGKQNFRVCCDIPSLPSHTKLMILDIKSRH